MAKKGRLQTRREQSEEADKIFEWLHFQRGLLSDLIRTSVRLISDKEEATTASLNLYTIVGYLTSVPPGGSDRIWKDYQNHFIGDRNRQNFFAKLQKLTRRIASAALVRVWQTGGESNPGINADFQWDTSLLPKDIAPLVLRLAILHPGLLEVFLPQMFIRASDCQLQGSTYRRAVSILQAVPEIGWSAEKHTRRLIELGELQPPETESKVETIKKFIRDLRRRLKKRLSLTQHSELAGGTSSARKGAA
jgi:hypothetical protein